MKRRARAGCAGDPQQAKPGWSETKSGGRQPLSTRISLALNPGRCICDRTAFAVVNPSYAA